jgi:hypothetical protein
VTGDHDRDGGEVPQGERDDRPELDIDTQFAAIIAGLREQTPGGVGRWPAAEDLSDPDAGPGDEPSDEESFDEPADARRVVLTGPLPGGSAVPGEVIADDDGGYVPPDPPPLPRGDLVSRLAWAGVLGGPLFLLVAAIVWQELPKGLLLAALAAFVGGFATLVARMPGDGPDDRDDGAVV